MSIRLQDIRMAHRHAAEGVPRAGAGDGALVAVDAAVVPDLEEERAVAETDASLDALSAADAEMLFNGVLVVGVFDVGALDGGGGAKLVLGGGGQRVRFRREEAGAKLAVSAHRVGVNALHCRLLQHAFRGAIATAKTLGGVNLPDPIFRLRVPGHHAAERAKRGNGGDAGAAAEEVAARGNGWDWRGWGHAAGGMTNEVRSQKPVD